MAEVLSQDDPGTPSHGSKSPGKSRKHTLGSLFKRSTDDSGSRSSKSERASGKSKRKSSREAKGGSRDSLDKSNDSHLLVDSYKKDEPKATASVIEHDDGLQEPEQKTIADLPVKKVQKLNKELAKQNTQLVKSVDTLKKQKEELLVDKQKLKSENKTLERELKRVSSKGEIQRISKKSSQMSIDVLDMTTTEELIGKVQKLEARVAEKDKKIRRIRERLEKLNGNLPNIHSHSDSDTTSSRESTVVQPISDLRTGSVMPFDSGVLGEDYSKLQLENTELRNKIATLESRLEQLQVLLSQRDATDFSSKPHPRKKSGSFFKRGKAQSKSMVMKSSEDVQREREALKDKEIQRSKSPDFFTVSDSFRLTSESTQNDFTADSLPNFSVVGLSPKTASKHGHSDIQTLQSCLQLAIDEKKSMAQQNKQLEFELVAAKEKIAELQTHAERLPAFAEEVENLKNSLTSETSEKATLSKRVSNLEKSCERFKSKNTLLEGQLAETIEKKDLEIANLNEKIRKLQKDLAESEDVFLASKKQSPAPPATVTSSVSSLDDNKTKRTITAKLPPSPARQVKPVTNQNATVENKPRKTSQPKLRRGSSSSSLSADERYDSVANTRAKFEQKIQSSTDTAKPVRKVSWSAERRGSYSCASPGSKPDYCHTKSSSFDATAPAEKSTAEASEVNLSEKHTNQQSSEPEQTNNKGNPPVSNKTVPQSSTTSSSSKPSVVDSSNAQKRSVSSTSTSPPAVKTTHSNFQRQLARYNEATKTQTSENNSPSSSVSKVAKITAKPQSVSTVTSSLNKNQVEQNSVQTVQKQASANSHLVKSSSQEASSPPVTKEVTSVSNKTTVYSRSSSVDSKKDVPIRNPTASTTVKRTTITPVRSNTVAQFNSVRVTTTPSPSTSVTTITAVRSAHSNLVKMTNTTASPTPSVMSVRANSVAQFNSVKISKPTQTPSVQPSTTPARSSTVPQFSSIKVTENTPSVSSVKITTTNASPQMQRANQRQQPQSSVPTGKQGMQKTQSMLTIPGGVKKASSLQDIPEQVSSESDSQSSVPPTTQASPVRQNPVAVRVQRRGRSERPKTMYAGRAETTNLVNLISRFQQQEAAKKESPKVSWTIGKGTPSSDTAMANGISSPQSSQVTLRSGINKSPTAPVVTRRSNTRAPRPNSYYGDPSAKIVSNVKPPTSPVSYRKPPPSERKLVRAQTVGTGLGVNRQSKKAMLLRWCQKETEGYNNVCISNFDSSFSDGMAFCALIHRFLPDKIPYSTLDPKNRNHNFTLAFKIAEEAGIPSLLDVEDMVDLPIPDWMSVMTYVSFIYNVLVQSRT